MALGYTKGNVKSNIYIKNGDHSIFLIISFYVDDFFNNLIFLAQAKSSISKKNWMIDNIVVHIAMEFNLKGVIKIKQFFYFKETR